MVNKAIAWIAAAILLVITSHVLGENMPYIGSAGVTDSEWFWTIVTLMIMGGGAASGDLMSNLMDGVKGMLPHLLWFFVAAVVYAFGMKFSAGWPLDTMAIVSMGLNAAATGFMASLWWSAIRSGI